MDGKDSPRALGKPGLQPRTLPSTHPGASSSQDGTSPGTSNESSTATTFDSHAPGVSGSSATTAPNSDASGPSPTSNPAAVAPASPPAAPAAQSAAPAAQPTSPASQHAVPTPTPVAAAPPPQSAATAAEPRKVLGPPRPAKKLPSRFASIGRSILTANWLVEKSDDAPSSNDQLWTRRSRSTMDSPELRPCTPAPVPHPPVLGTSPSSSPQRTDSLTRRASDWYHPKKRKVPREETDSDSPAESDAQSTRRRSEDENRVHKNSLFRNGAAVLKYLKNQDRERVQ